MAQCVRMQIRVRGVVQGVGFRPFVHALATGLGLSGQVGNDGAGVFVEVEGPLGTVEQFLAALGRDAPPLACVEGVTARQVAPTGAAGFAIAASPADGRRQTLVSADTATCPDCLRELTDPADRRFGYPFVNCTNCGPRFTIVRGVPYDRPRTTMAGFALCPRCAAEYHDPTDRRFHAQPVCCPRCGPRLRLVDRHGQELTADPAGDPVAGAVRLLRAGDILAVKGLGGFHLAVDAGNERAAAALRAGKHREDKPFAVLVADLDQARRLCRLNPADEELLTSRARPVLLAERRAGAPVAASVAPGSRELGVLLPYTPLHHLLARRMGRAVVLTSGNLSDEPIAYVDDDALRRLGRIAAAFLTHDRPIHVRTDDSVVRTFRGRPLPVRRSRGYAPEPVRVPWEFSRPVLACGAELKNTFCLARGEHAFVSHHVGDLANYQTLASFRTGIEHYSRLFGIVPEVVAHDLHPEYLSTKYARDLPDVDLVGVQHHHAHVASCLADNGEPGPVIGVAFDGTGYGSDGTLWGGELLLADLAGFRRLGHLAPVPMPGGTAAIREPWRMAAVYLDAAYAADIPAGLEVTRRNAARWADVLALARRGVNSPVTSSAGRLFDAVAALLGLRDSISYEGQAAVELEQCADRAERAGYPAAIAETDPLRLVGADLVRAAADDLRDGVAPAVIAARFHNGVADLVVRACRMLRSSTGVGVVALSGGVFVNQVLLERVVSGLERHGFRVLVHQRVPPNDGGISLGQAVVAATAGPG